jgi:hypothetical protein
MGDKCGAGATLRLGATTIVKNLYFFTDLTLGGYKAKYWDRNTQPIIEITPSPYLYFNVSLNVGYRF